MANLLVMAAVMVVIRVPGLCHAQFGTGNANEFVDSVRLHFLYSIFLLTHSPPTAENPGIFVCSLSGVHLHGTQAIT